MVSILAAFLAVVVLSSTVFAANGVDAEWIKVNGDIVQDGDNLRVELGDELEIRVRLQATRDVEDLEVQARLIGYEYNNVENLIDITRPFDMEENDTETVDLSLTVPIRADKDEYELRIQIDDRRTNFVSDSFTIRVKGPRTNVRIKDVIFSPHGEVLAGRLLVSQVRIENIGERDLDDIKVVAEIPALGVADAKFLDEELDGSKVGNGDTEITEDLLLRIPECAEPGVYDVDFTVSFDEYEETTFSRQIRVVGDACETQGSLPSQQQTQKSVITPPPAQDIAAGQSGSYPIVITNAGAQAQDYTVQVRGAETWAVVDVTDPAPIVQPGESKTVYVYVSVNENAAVGQKVFTVEVSDGRNRQEFPVVTSVTEAQQQTSSLRRALEIGLIVLIVLLIVLGLIIGFNKMRSNNDDDEPRGQTYY